MLVTYSVGHGRIDLIDKVVVIAVELLRVNAYNRSLGRLESLLKSKSKGRHTIFLMHHLDLPGISPYLNQVVPCLIKE